MVVSYRGYRYLSDAFGRPNNGGSGSQSPQPPSKKPTVAAKQENVSAAVRVAKFGKDKVFVDDGKLFCRAVVDYIRKTTVERHLKRQAI